MIAFEKFLGENPDLAEKPYGDAMAASLSRAFLARPDDRSRERVRIHENWPFPEGHL
ncbi:MAG TPA: hypothetical protein VJY34_14310 [Roseiarcus sp.]|nr:hypothetical protein [Roseiarcus sp.]